MLDEYSIEQRAAQIFDARTKEYFAEVLSCYVAGNYRSAVVMLWSVAVCDLLFKLQNLVDLYADAKAKDSMLQCWRNGSKGMLILKSKEPKQSGREHDTGIA